MNFYYHRVFTIVIVMFISCNNKVATSSNTSDSLSNDVYYWSDLNMQDEVPVCEGRIMPLKYRIMKTDYLALRKLLLPDSKSPEAEKQDTISLLIPLPDGSWELYKIYPVEVMAPELAAKFPEIRTYSGINSSNSADHIRLDISPRGFSSMILSEKGTMIIDPFCLNDTLHVICYNKSDLPPDSKQPFEK